jgi:hypothetical protein
MGIPRSVAKLMVGHKTDSVYERYNVASKRDLDVAREKMDGNAMERLYSASNSTSISGFALPGSHELRSSNSHPPARHGQSLGKVEPFGPLLCSNRS